MLSRAESDFHYVVQGVKCSKDEERGALILLHAGDQWWSLVAPSGKAEGIRCHLEDEKRDVRADNIWEKHWGMIWVSAIVQEVKERGKGEQWQERQGIR